MAPPVGFEPTTNCLEGNCSVPWATEALKNFNRWFSFNILLRRYFFSTNRTLCSIYCDKLSTIFASYHFNIFIFSCRTWSKTHIYSFLYGGANWNRTSDTRLFRPLLYLLSYGPINYLAPCERLELPTPAFVVLCSNPTELTGHYIDTRYLYVWKPCPFVVGLVLKRKDFVLPAFLKSSIGILYIFPFLSKQNK